MVFWSKDNLFYCFFFVVIIKKTNKQTNKQNPQLCWDFVSDRVTSLPTVFGVTFRLCGKNRASDWDTVLLQKLRLQADLPTVPLQPERKAASEAKEDGLGRVGGGGRVRETCIRFLVLLPSRASASRPALPRCRAASLWLARGPSDHRGLDSAEGVSSFGVGGAGRGDFGGQV